MEWTDDWVNDAMIKRGNGKRQKYNQSSNLSYITTKGLKNLSLNILIVSYVEQMTSIYEISLLMRKTAQVRRKKQSECLDSLKEMHPFM